MNFRSELYFGSVMHRRQRPQVHDLRYRMFWMLLDLDELEELDKRFWNFSYNRFNILSFHDADFGDGSSVALRTQVESHLRETDIDLEGGHVKLLCMPRIFGYSFNPLSLYFCYHFNGDLLAILYEVHNTFGERHSYLIPVDSQQMPVNQTCAKGFHVSPFMGMDMTYSFRVSPPGRRLSVSIRGADEKGLLIVATLAAQRAMLNQASLLRALFTYPLLTLKVISAIHWNALLLWRKGVCLHAKPIPPSSPITIVTSNRHIHS